MRIANWLENHWVVPAYSGWVLASLSVCFLGAAINTMAGWLYVLSGLSLAMLGMAAVLPTRSLLGIAVRRRPIQAISAGEQLTIELEIENQTTQPKNLLQVEDVLPYVLGQPVSAPIEIIPPQASYRSVYYHKVENRGVYRWQTVYLRTATPLGLFWCRRQRDATAKAIVYPTVLPLTNCPLVDEMGQEINSQHYNQQRRFQAASDGLTRSLRPYRQGDPTRLIHWRTSARYGELRVRELEVVTAGQEIIICLDGSATWQQVDFEQAAIAAASLYFYAHRQQLHVKLWTALTGLVQGEQNVLAALAATQPGEEPINPLPNRPVIWLSQDPHSLNLLTAGSRWVLWSNILSPKDKSVVNHNYPGLLLQTNQPLQLQLQKSLKQC